VHFFPKLTTVARAPRLWEMAYPFGGTQEAAVWCLPAERQGRDAAKHGDAKAQLADGTDPSCSEALFMPPDDRSRSQSETQSHLIPLPPKRKSNLR
jgi:hypothetical protein